MDSQKIHHSRLKTSITLILILFLTLFASNIEGSENLKKDDGNKGVMNQKKLVLGSRPPRCIHKCLNCRPCMAVLVISPHHKVGHIHKAIIESEKDEGYYLLSWKCKCGNKFFQP
ncbi:unnamed protein product [Trifolium pratense]|uniref:Uncharacterized protein n=1 Tax=Trifolium pratense TaxID=57577 RepID=A0ACB0IQK0_TRIPR|nr:unnamed protein product [Trifolium pratense]